MYTMIMAPRIEQLKQKYTINLDLSLKNLDDIIPTKVDLT